MLELEMILQPVTWARIRFVTFSIFFVLLVVALWTYSYENTLIVNGSITVVYPYRDYTVFLILSSILLFGVSVVSISKLKT